MYAADITIFKEIFTKGDMKQETIQIIDNMKSDLRMTIQFMVVPFVRPCFRVR